jgi:hypothetical protein
MIVEVQFSNYWPDLELIDSEVMALSRVGGVFKAQLICADTLIRNSWELLR